jgi:ferritin-like metal-binding protein YciE
MLVGPLSAAPPAATLACHWKGTPMTATLASPALKEKLIDYLQDAHALERNVLSMLGSLIASSGDPEVRDRLRRHINETDRHLRIVNSRLAALGASRSMIADAAAVAPSLVKGLIDQVRPDRQGKVGRDAYVTEHVEIAAYSLLERLAERAGDHETAEAASFIRTEEQEMADWVAERWDRFIDLTLDDSGIDGPRPPGYTPRQAPGLLGTLAASPMLLVAGAGLGMCAYRLTRRR